MDQSKQERVLRALQGQPANKRCFNCDSLVSLHVCMCFRRQPWIYIYRLWDVGQHTVQLLSTWTQGTQYVVPSLAIFVCTECSGKQ